MACIIKIHDKKLNQQTFSQINQIIVQLTNLPLDFQCNQPTFLPTDWVPLGLTDILLDQGTSALSFYVTKTVLVT